MHPTRNNIGVFTREKIGISPQSLSGSSEVDGAGFDRTGYDSCVLVAQCGAATGSPSGYSIGARLQHSEQSGSGFVDLPSAAIVALTADNSIARVAVDLARAKQFIRAVLTPSFTGGTSPSVPTSASIVLGGRDELPA